MGSRKKNPCYTETDKRDEENFLSQLHYWAAAAGAIFVIGVGYLLVRSRRAAEENV